jgi:hypothetical protein
MRRALVRNYHRDDGHGMVPPPDRRLLDPAYSVLPWVRWPVGYDHAAPISAICRVVLLTILPQVGWFLWCGFTGTPWPKNTGQWYLIYFASFCAVASCAVWALRLFGVGRGVEINSAEAGWSRILWYVPFLPPWLCEIVIVPALFIFAGWQCYSTFSRNLGAWLVLCGLSLALMAQWELRRRIRADLTVIDLRTQGETSGWRMERQERRARRRSSGAGAAARDFAESASGPLLRRMR